MAAASWEIVKLNFVQFLFAYGRLAEMDDTSSPGNESLRLVDLEEYHNLYRELKQKYVPSVARVNWIGDNP